MSLHPRYVQTLVWWCKKEISETRAPNDFGDYLRETNNSHETSVLRTLHRQNVIAWIANLLAGQDIEGLNNLSTTDITSVIAQCPRSNVSKSSCDTTSRAVGARRPIEVRYYLSSSFNRPADEFQQDAAPNLAFPLLEHPVSPDMTDPQQSALHNVHHTEDTTAQHNDADSLALGIHTQQSMHDVQLDLTGQHVHQPEAFWATNYVRLRDFIGFDIYESVHIFSPSTVEVHKALPLYTACFIAQEQGYTWLRLSHGGPRECYLELFINASETQYLVSYLFDEQLVICDGRWNLRLHGNTSVHWDSSITFCGTLATKLAMIFGQHTLIGMEGSRLRMKGNEKESGYALRTRCLTMKVWPNIDCPSLLSLAISAEGLETIRQHLQP
jgi:hypothetical protein